MFPRNWGTKEYADPSSDDDFPHGPADGRRRRGGSRGQTSGSRSDPPFIAALRTPVVNHPGLVPPPRVFYDEWRRSKGDIWISKPNRNSPRIADVHRRCFR